MGHSHTMGAALAVTAGILAVSGVAAAEPEPPAPVPASSSPPAAQSMVRLAMAPAAAEYLTEVRVRRLLEVELGDAVSLAPEPTGPIDEPTVRVWIDLPEPSRVVVEVKAPARRLVRRRINITGLQWDVSARFVAIAVSQMVRRQLRPLPVKPLNRPRPPTEEERIWAERRDPSAWIAGRTDVAWLPEAGGFLVGPHLALGMHTAGFQHELGVRLLGGDGDASLTRWIELGASGAYRFWVHPSLRLVLGARAGMATVRLGDAGLASEDEFSTLVSGNFGVEARASGHTWLTAALQPGFLLREVPYELDGEQEVLGGAWLGLSLGVSVEQVIGSMRRESPPSPRTAATGRR